MSKNSSSGPGIVTIALGVFFGLVLASEEGVFNKSSANVPPATPDSIAVTAQTPAPVLKTAVELPASLTP